MEAGAAQQFDEYGNVQGKFLFLDVHKAPFIDENGRMIGTVGSARDVTAIKDLEKQLRKNENQLRTLVQAIPDLIWLKNPEGVYLDCNPKFEQFFGAAQKDIIGKTDYHFVSKELADFFRENDKQAAEAGMPVTNEEWITFADDGHKALMETTKAPILDSDGTLLGVLGIARDITKRKQTEDALQNSLAEKEVLLREVHHRVKNNMAAIIGLFNLQRQAMEDPQVQAVLADLSSRVRAMSLVHEKLYRSESLAKIDFQDYLQSLISHLRTSFGSPHIECQIAALGVEMPLDLAVPCGMIINELVTNALKHAFPGKPSGSGKKVDKITVAVYRDHDSFSMSVADNGVGLPPEFDLNTTETLGLVLVRMLGQHQLGGAYEIEQMGGTRITFNFTVGKGGKTHA
jgi:PAS domain S-box-containing protein